LFWFFFFFFLYHCSLEPTTNGRAKNFPGHNNDIFGTILSAPSINVSVKILPPEKYQWKRIYQKEQLPFFLDVYSQDIVSGY